MHSLQHHGKVWANDRRVAIWRAEYSLANKTVPRRKAHQSPRVWARRRGHLWVIRGSPSDCPPSPSSRHLPSTIHERRGWLRQRLSWWSSGFECRYAAHVSESAREWIRYAMTVDSRRCDEGRAMRQCFCCCPLEGLDKYPGRAALVRSPREIARIWWTRYSSPEEAVVG